MIFLTSDTHFCHTNIIKYASRPFTSSDEMDETIVRNWNYIVGVNDTVYHLGDVGIGSPSRIKELVLSLNGNKTLIMGNHDYRKTVSWWQNAGFRNVVEGGIILDQFFLLSHAPLYINEACPFVNIHGHLHGNELVTAGVTNRYMNVCVEKTAFTPITFESIQLYFTNLLEPEEI